MSAVEPNGKVVCSSRALASCAPEQPERCLRTEEEFRIGVLLGKLFEVLNRTGIPYCIMRNYAQLPWVVGNDVDILVTQNALGELKAALDGLLAELGWRRTRLEYRYGLEGHFLVAGGKSNIVLHLDIQSIIHWKGIPFALPRTILSRRQRYNGFFVASPGCQSAVLLLKELLQHGYVKDKARDEIASLANTDQEGFIAAIEPCFGSRVAQSILTGAQREDWEGLQRDNLLLRGQLVKHAIMREPFRQFRRWVSFLWVRLLPWIWGSSGLFVVFVGPDGSGKSTIARAVMNRLGKSLFRGGRYYHYRFEFLPELKRLWNPARRFAGDSVQVKAGGDTVVYSPARSLLYLCYYIFDYLLGHLAILRSKRNDRLVVFDRYLYDSYIQRTFARVPRRMIRFLLRFVPAPDLVIYLHADPELVRKRKPELSVLDIRWQQKRCGQLLEMLPYAVRIEASRPIAEVEDAAVSHILATSCKRLRQYVNS